MKSISKRCCRWANSSGWHLRRVLLKNPRYVLLDEATSALDRENEDSLYQQLAATSATIVSVTHHPSLVKYHSQILELKPDGEWSLYPASEYRLTENLV